MSPRRPGPAKNRFTLWLPEALMREVETVRVAQHKESTAEVVRDALAVYLSLLKARGADVELHFRNAATGESGPVWVLPGPPPGTGVRRSRPKG